MQLSRNVQPLSPNQRIPGFWLQCQLLGACLALEPTSQSASRLLGDKTLKLLQRTRGGFSMLELRTEPTRYPGGPALASPERPHAPHRPLSVVGSGESGVLAKA